jgi:hypothetical protein
MYFKFFKENSIAALRYVHAAPAAKHIFGLFWSRQNLK